MRHPTEGVLRRLLDEPAGVSDSDRQHVADCTAVPGRAGRARARTRPSSARHWRPSGARTSTSRGLAALAANLPATESERAPAPARSSRTRGFLRRPAVAVLAFAVVLAGAGTAAANDWLQIFQTEQVAPVGIRTADLIALPDLSAYGELAVTGDPDVHEVADAAAAEAESGLDVPEVDDAAPRGQRRAGVPGGRRADRHLHLLGRARRPGGRRGRGDPAAPAAGPGREPGAAGRRPGRGPGLVVVVRRCARPARRPRRRAESVLLRRRRSRRCATTCCRCRACPMTSRPSCARSPPTAPPCRCRCPPTRSARRRRR